jgi:hypothetical protein
LILVEPSNLELLAGSKSEHYEEHLDRDRFIAQLRGAMDSKTLALFEYRRLDYSWKEIALALSWRFRPSRTAIRRQGEQDSGVKPNSNRSEATLVF